MQKILIFKGVWSVDDAQVATYHWENVADESPKQLFCVKNDVIAKVFPKVNQQYIVRYKRLEGANMIEPYSVVDHHTTCSYWKAVGCDLVFKKGKNKGLTVAQYASAFPYNPDEEKSFVKSLTALYRKSNNTYTRNNIMRIFNSGVIKYCEVFGYDGSVIQLGNYKGTDITVVPAAGYVRVRNRLEYFISTVVSPITKANCTKWIKYLDHKFPQK